MFPKIFNSGTADAKAEPTTPDTTKVQPPPGSGPAGPVDVASAPPSGTVTADGKPAEPPSETDSKPTKMALATEVFRRLSRKKGTTRKEIVAAFIEEVGLSKAGSATYYQLIKKARR